MSEPGFSLFCRKLALFVFDMMSFRQIIDRIQKFHVLELHDEVDHVSAFSASETFEHIPADGNDERWRLLIMERTTAFM